MMNKIGDKSIFAIEYSCRKAGPHLLGHIRIWLNNRYIGYFPEEVMLDCSLGSLIELVSDDRQYRLSNISIPDLHDDQLFDYLRNDDGDVRDNSMFNMDESTDDFIIFVLRLGRQIKFLWKLSDQPCRDIQNYPKGVLSADVDIDYLNEIINEFDLKLSEVKSNNRILH